MNKLLIETDAKKLLEIKKNYPNLTQAIYDLPDSPRRHVLNHIKSYSKHIKKLHIFTDIDDTIYPSRFGGCDLTFKNHIVYPGVLSFYKYVPTSGYVTLLTARPKSLYSDTKDKISKAIGRPVDVLNGYLKDLNPGIGADIIRRLFQPILPLVRSYPSKIEHLSGKEATQWFTNYNDMGKTKFISILKYISVYPEFNFIFIGDSGQGDMICAYEISEQKRNNPNFPVKACFIHNVIKSKESKPFRMIQDKQFITDLKNRHIYLFNNYIDLANHLYSLKLISKKKLDKIVKETIIDFNENKKGYVYDNDPNIASYVETELIYSANKQKDI